MYQTNSSDFFRHDIRFPKSDPSYMSEINVTRLKELLADKGLNAFQAAKLANKGRTFVYDIIEGNSKNPKAASLRDLAKALGVQPSELMTNSTPQSVEETAVPFATKPIVNDVPIYGAVLADDGSHSVIDFDEPVGMAPRPDKYLKNRKIYVLYVSGNSMFPRYQPGQKVYVDPIRPPRPGDDVVVQLFKDDSDAADFDKGIIKTLKAERRESYSLTQYHPQKDIEIPTRLVKDIHYVCTLEDLFGF